MFGAWTVHWMSWTVCSMSWTVWRRIRFVRVFSVRTMFENSLVGLNCTNPHNGLVSTYVGSPACSSLLKQETLGPDLYILDFLSTHFKRAFVSRSPPYLIPGRPLRHSQYATALKYHCWNCLVTPCIKRNRQYGLINAIWWSKSYWLSTSVPDMLVGFGLRSLLALSDTVDKLAYPKSCHLCWGLMTLLEYRFCILLRI